MFLQKKEFSAKIVKVNIKTYTVEDNGGERYRIDKLDLFGYSTVYDEIGTTEKMKIGNLVRMKKKENKEND